MAEAAARLRASCACLQRQYPPDAARIYSHHLNGFRRENYILELTLSFDFFITDSQQVFFTHVRPTFHV